MKTITTLSGSALSLLILAGCATDPNNDPHSGGFFGGVHGLASGDYDARQQILQEQRGESLNQLRALREEGSYLEAERQMKLLRMLPPSAGNWRRSRLKTGRCQPDQPIEILQDYDRTADGGSAPQTAAIDRQHPAI